MIFLDLALPPEPAGALSLKDFARAVVSERSVWAALVAAVLIVAGVPAVFNAVLASRVEAYREDQREHARNMERLAGDRAKVDSAAADNERLRGTLGSLARLEGRRYAWPMLMHGVAQAVPEYAWVEGLEMDAPAGEAGVYAFRVRGVAASQAVVSRFERGLDPLGGTVVLESSAGVAAGPFPLVRFGFGGTLGAPDSAAAASATLGGV